MAVYVAYHVSQSPRFASFFPPSFPPYLSGLASQATKPSCTGRDNTATEGFRSGWVLYDCVRVERESESRERRIGYRLSVLRRRVSLSMFSLYVRNMFTFEELPDQTPIHNHVPILLPSASSAAATGRLVLAFPTDRCTGEGPSASCPAFSFTARLGYRCPSKVFTTWRHGFFLPISTVYFGLCVCGFWYRWEGRVSEGACCQ